MTNKYCPMDEMLEVNFTKKLQGNLFQRSRQEIINMSWDKNGDNFSNFEQRKW